MSPKPSPIAIPVAFFSSLLPELRKTIRLSLPIMLGQAGGGILFVLDTMMAGALGDTALAAAGFVGNTVILPVIFGFGLASAVSVLIAQGRGAGRPQDAPAALRHGLMACGAYGLLVGAGIHAAVLTGALGWFGQPPAVVSAGGDFAIWLGWATVPAMLFQCMKNEREAENQPWIALLWLGIGVLVNAALNWVLMFGNYGAPALGLAGAGIGTFVARTVSLIGITIHPGGLRPRWRDGMSLRWFRALFSLGIPSAVQWTFEVGVFTCAAILMGSLGEKHLAAHQITVSLATFAFMFPAGLSQGASIRVGEAYGRRDAPAMRRISFGAVLFGGFVMGLYGLLLLLFRHEVPAIYLSAEKSSPETLLLASQFLFAAALFSICDGLQVVASGALRGMSDVKFASASAFVCYWLVSLPVAYLLMRLTNLQGMAIWLGLSCGIFSAAVILNARLLSNLKKAATGALWSGKV
ncbi:MAG: MATE family efflux transporter [Puniceicoccales bacterium]|nr:MATE family efflux transporter [Puniceicoccales bacterium]